MTLEEKIINDAAMEMSREIDFQVLAEMLVQIGWKKVELIRFHNNIHAVDVKQWCVDHIKNPWENCGATFVFENQGDAVNFALKWL